MKFQQRFESFESYYLYGYTELTSQVATLLKHKGKSLLAIIDRDPRKNGISLDGDPVISPSQFFDRYKASSAIIIVSAYLLEIYSSLLEKGVPASSIFPLLDPMFYPTYGGFYLDNITVKSVAKLLPENESIWFNNWCLFKETANVSHIDQPLYCINTQYDHPVWCDSIPDGGICLDVGAYDGQSSIDFFKTNRFQSVISFEPFQKNFSLLQRNIKANCLESYVTPMRIALGSQDKDYFVEYKDSSPRTQISSFSPGSHGELVREKRLDSLAIRDISLIKVDIEGYELKFLEGARQTILQERPNLIISAYHDKKHCYAIYDFCVSLGIPFNLNLGHHPLALYEIEYYIHFLR